MALPQLVRNTLVKVFGDQAPSMERLAAEQQEFLNAAADMGAERLAGYAIYQHYYDGDHTTALLDRAKKYLEASGLPFAENFCETVADKHAARLRLTGFQVQDRDDVSDWLNTTWWPRGRMDEKQGNVHHGSLLKGDGFLILEWDEERGLPRACWNPPENIKPIYADDGETLEILAKTWPTSRRSVSNPSGMAIRRLNLYYPDRIEKWFAASKGENAMWAPFIDEADMEDLEDGERQPTWPLPWVDTDGKPLGIPAFHFRPGAKGATMGRSILRGVIPQNDQLNKQVLDLFYVMDAQGWKQRWATGVGDGSLSVAIGEWVKGPAEAKFGEFTAENPEPMLKAIDATLRRLAARSRTPLHDLMADKFSSGEERKDAESGLVEATRERHIPLGGTWEDLARMSWRLGSVFGDAPDFDPDAEITVGWDDPETRNEKTEAETLLIHEELGASKATILRKLGYEPEEEAKQRAKEAEEATAAFGPPPPPPGGEDTPPAA